MFGDGLSREEVREAQDPTKDSRSSIPEGWGIFPRTVLSALDKIRNPDLLQNAADPKYKVLSWTFSASVIEMYF